MSQTLPNGYPISAVQCIALDGGDVSEMIDRYRKCMCDKGVSSHCPKGYVRPTTTPQPRPREPSPSPTTIGITNAGGPRWRTTTTTTATTTTTPRWTWHEQEQDNNREGCYYGQGCYYNNTPEGLPAEGGTSLGQVLGWGALAVLLAAIAAVVLCRMRYSRRRQAATGTSQRLDSGTERSCQFPEPGAPETVSLRPSAPPATNPADDLPPPYELVAHPAPPPYQAAMGPDDGTPGFDGEAKYDATKGEERATGKDGDAATRRSDFAARAAEVCVTMDEDHGDAAARTRGDW